MSDWGGHSTPIYYSKKFFKKIVTKSQSIRIGVYIIYGMLNPVNTLNYLYQIRGKIKGLEYDLRNSEDFSEALKLKKKEWLGIYSNLAEVLELKYFILTSRVN